MTTWPTFATLCSIYNRGCRIGCTTHAHMFHLTFHFHCNVITKKKVKNWLDNWMDLHANNIYCISIYCLKMTIFYLNIFLHDQSCIFSIITPVFSVTWSSEIILICLFAAQKHFLLLWMLKKVVLLHIFVETVIHFFRILWWIEQEQCLFGFFVNINVFYCHFF